MIEITRVKLEERELLNNLLQLYMYEFSQYLNNDVNEKGQYEYDYLSLYFTDENRYAYIVRVNEKVAGFVMVNDYPVTSSRDIDYSIAEFFILHKYRRCGIGKRVAFEVFNNHRGAWQLKILPENKTSVIFWKKIINEYTNGNYDYVESLFEEGMKLHNGNPPAAILFNNKK